MVNTLVGRSVDTRPCFSGASLAIVLNAAAIVGGIASLADTASAQVVLANDTRYCTAFSSGCGGGGGSDADAPSAPFAAWNGGAGVSGHGTDGAFYVEAMQISDFTTVSGQWTGVGSVNGGCEEHCDAGLTAASVADFYFSITGLHQFTFYIDLGVGQATCDAEEKLTGPSGTLFDHALTGSPSGGGLHTSYASLLGNGSYHFNAHTTGSCSGGTFGGAVFQYQINFARCVADFNSDGIVDYNDYLDFVDAFSNNDPSADINGDGIIDYNDYLDFVDHLSGGC